MTKCIQVKAELLVDLTRQNLLLLLISNLITKIRKPKSKKMHLLNIKKMPISLAKSFLYRLKETPGKPTRSLDLNRARQRRTQMRTKEWS